MKELIFKQDAINQIMSVPDGNWKSERYAKEIEKMPAVQPEIIRCKECKYHSHDAGYGRDWCNRITGVFRVTEDDFCSYAVRRTDETD